MVQIQRVILTNVYFGHLHVQISATNPLPSANDSLFDASHIELHQDRSISV